jgi:signal transduction histidine kinase
VKQQFNDEIAKLQTTFEVREKDKEILLLGKNQELKNLALSRQKVLIISITTALILVLIIGFLVVNRYRIKNRANRMIEMERMRNTIARDLHDDIGSTLSSINIMSQIALQQNGNEGHQHLQKIANHSARMMENMSDIVWSINPKHDSLEQLVTKMKEFASEILEPKEIDYKFSIGLTVLNLKIDVEKRKNIFLIFKEAINNAAKYSEGNQVTVSLFHSTGILHLTIGDNGKGFDATHAKKGNGLRNMQDRAITIKGDLKRSSNPGEGTQIDLEVPLA